MRRIFPFNFFLIFVFIFIFIGISTNLIFAAEDQCTSGLCCDTSVSPKVFRPSTYACNSWTEYGCPWGTDYGNDVGKRTATQYCSGNSADCNGSISYSGWSVVADCNSCSVCVPGNAVCQAVAAPLSPTNGAIDVPLPVTLDWCDGPGAQSYIIQIYKDGEIRHVDGVTKIDDTLESKIEIDGLDVFTGKTTYEWEVTACLNENGTKCGADCGEDESVEDCADFSQKWSFTTAGETETIKITPPQLLEPFYDPTKPTEIPVVNLSDSLEWTRTEEKGKWARSYFFEIREGTTTVVSPTLTTSYIIPFETIWSSLSFNTIYNWHVKSCYGEGGTDCSDFGETWYFKTTGLAPNQLNADTTIIPVKLDWEDIPGALSYKYEVIDISTNEKVATGTVSLTVGTPPSEILVDYPNLKQEKIYSWKVRTCADREGEDPFCGTWSNSQEFTTFKLSTPSNPTPEDGGKLYTYDKYISWYAVAGAKAYQYTIDYIELSSEEKTEKCQGLVGIKVIPSTITSSPYLLLPLECLGKYHWSVRACLDKDCQETGDWSGPWLFNFVQPTPVGKAGLVPCGRTIDYPETPWNEREPCQFKHIFILLKNIIDLLLWRIGLMILVLLVIATGVVYYFSMGAPTTMAKVKSILKSAGMGYAIIFLAWVIINLILSILGYKIGIFGRWWMFSF